MTISEILEDKKRHKYSLLGRLQSDCEYFLGYGNGSPNRLWAKNVKRQISLMKIIYRSFSKKDKPKWITIKKINYYKWKMNTKGV